MATCQQQKFLSESDGQQFLQVAMLENYTIPINARNRKSSVVYSLE